jgi:hypothetical protein
MGQKHLTSQVTLRDLSQISSWDIFSLQENCISVMVQLAMKDNIFLKKLLVSIPPLGMVNDELTIAECCPDATLTNTAMNTFTESKKLRFGIKKCIKMHFTLRRHQST